MCKHATTFSVQHRVVPFFLGIFSSLFSSILSPLGEAIMKASAGDCEKKCEAILKRF